MNENIIRDEGIEDFNKKEIEENFTKSEDDMINKKYIEVRTKTHTKVQTSVSNVENGIYNLHTWLTNCTQLYNINYSPIIEGIKLVIEIENKEEKKELVDVNAQAISNYIEVFETNIVSKVIVLTSSDTYTLYLLNDRTTTTDKNNKNRAKGRTETVYTEDYKDARQKALDTIKSNTYNHNVSFSLFKYIKIGTPVAIKTKESIILNTYISAIKITSKKAIEYTCGTIRVKFIDKLLKERKK